MRIKYVVSTMVFWGRENRLSLEQECQLLKSLGFGVEFWPNTRGLDECRYDKRNWPRLIAATEGMLVSMRSRNDNPTLQQWDEQLECAKLLNANIVADLQSLGIANGPEINGWDFITEIIKLAELKDVKLCIETGKLPILLQIAEKYPSIYYCLDTGYANLDAEFDFKQYVGDLAPRVTHLHLTDNYGRTDDHEPPGVRGGISREKWDYLLNTLNKYDNDVVGALEMSPCMPIVMIHQASEFLFDELKWPNHPRNSVVTRTRSA